MKRWLEKRGVESAATERVGVSINRQDLISLPVPSAKLLWRHLRVRKGKRIENKSCTRNVHIEIGVEGSDLEQGIWRCHLEFDYANEESIYCRPAIGMPVPSHLKYLQVAYLPPMSGLAAREGRELENYLCHKETLLGYAEERGRKQAGELFAVSWQQAMEKAIQEIEQALQTLDKDAWGAAVKASDEVSCPSSRSSIRRLDSPTR